jgi:transcriptional regulator with XRE-family HTH domain
MILLRRLLGDVLRRSRQHQSRTLREVSTSARVSLGYLSEIERGQKEASSEMLESICGALNLPLSSVLREVSDGLATAETIAGHREPVADPAGAKRVADPAGAKRVADPVGAKQMVTAGARLRGLGDPAAPVPQTVPVDLPPLEPRGSDAPVGSGAVHAG